MKRIYNAEVVYSDRQSEVMAEQTECDSLEEFIQSIIDLNREIGNEGDEAVLRLIERDFDVELDDDGETQRVYVIVRIDM